MQHTQQQVATQSRISEITYLIDQGSGCEQDESVVWIIDLGNEAEWENQVPYILD
jgi:hypothetical protein